MAAWDETFFIQFLGSRKSRSLQYISSSPAVKHLLWLDVLPLIYYTGVHMLDKIGVMDKNLAVLISLCLSCLWNYTGKGIVGVLKIK